MAWEFRGPSNAPVRPWTRALNKNTATTVATTLTAEKRATSPERRRRPRLTAPLTRAASARVPSWRDHLLGERVLRLRGVLHRPPPRLVVAVPVDRRGEAVPEALVARGPAELAAQLAGLDRVAPVVPRAVGDVVVGVGILAHQLEDQCNHVAVVHLGFGADQVGLPDTAAVDDGPHRIIVVVDVDPVTDIEPVAVELGPDAVHHVGDLPRDELLDVLAGTVVVRAVRDRGPQAEGAHPRPHEVVGAGLAGGVGRARGVGGVLGELLG